MNVREQPLEESEPSSQQLALQSQAGCRDSFESLVERYEKRIFNFLCQFVQNPNDAEDLTQETFVRAYQSLLRYDARFTFGTWLFTIAKRSAISHLRSRRPPTEPLPEERIDPDSDDPARALDRKDQANSLWTVARQLPANQYRVLWLRYAEDFSIEEMARILGLTRIHVKVLLHRARASLLKRWTDRTPAFKL